MFLLVGNPNVGKTTLFNQLTKSKLHTGNFSGVTVEKEAAYIVGTKRLLVDLPGTYSFSSCQLDEQITIDALLSNEYKGIIQVIDGTHLKQGLQLTFQLLELNKPLMIIINMKDEMIKKGLMLDEKKLESYLGISVLYLQASKMNKKNYEDFIKSINQIANSKFKFDYGQVESLIKYHLQKNHNNRFITITQVESIQEQLYSKRREFINRLYESCVSSNKHDNNKTEKIDRIFLHPWWGTISFLIIMLICYQISFGSGLGGVGFWLRNYFEKLYFNNLISFLKNSYYQGGIIKGSFLDGLLSQGVLGGMGSVIVFLPQIIILYFLLYLLEGSGYLARVMVATDYLLARWGLSGSSIVPMIYSLGCSVPAVLACRRIENPVERRLTIILIPFISCSARLPVYAMLVSVFFSRYQALIIMALYLLGIFVVLFSARLFSLTFFKTKELDFMLELPPYRRVPLKAITKEIIKRIDSFLRKAGSIILIGSILLWVLTYDPRQNLENSFLGFWAKYVAVFFKPLGFGTWQSVIALLTGFMAKETIISSFSILYNLNGDFALLRNYYTTFDALCFLVFVSLYVPCLATIATIKQESNKKSDIILSLIYPLIVSYTITLILRFFGLMFQVR